MGVKSLDSPQERIKNEVNADITCTIRTRIATDGSSRMYWKKIYPFDK
jgi:hypothetical protein